MACNDGPAICRGMQELYKNTVKIYLLKTLPVIIADKINNLNPAIIIILQRSESIFLNSQLSQIKRDILFIVHCTFYGSL